MCQQRYRFYNSCSCILDLSWWGAQREGRGGKSLAGAGFAVGPARVTGVWTEWHVGNLPFTLPGRTRHKRGPSAPTACHASSCHPTPS